MKAKYVLLAILLATLLANPAFSFWHPPEEVPPCPYFGVMINGEWSNSSKPYELVEPGTGFCDDITVEVYMGNVEDLYGYEFELWWDPDFFALKSWVVASVWPQQFVVKPEDTYAGERPYRQIVAAMAPSTGVSGNILLATLTFHIINDVCWCQGNQTRYFEVYGKASDSCSQPLKLCSTKHGYVKLVPVQPKVYLTPPEEINWIVGDKFTLSVMIENITKMRSFHFEMYWYGFEVKTPWQSWWFELINTTKADVTINPEVFPSTKFTSTITLWNSGDNKTFGLFVDIQPKDPSKPLLVNGTLLKAVDIVFTKRDPWYCGKQPNYTRTGEHNWQPQNATTDIFIEFGYIDVLCPSLCPIYFGTYFPNTKGVWDQRYWDYGWRQRGWICVAMYANAEYIFMPVPGDLTGNGHVDLTDLLIIAGYYGLDWSTWEGYWYDLNKDGKVDIFDVVIVAKNFCRTSPF